MSGAPTQNCIEEKSKKPTTLPTGWSLETVSSVVDKFSTNKKKVKQKNYLLSGKYPVFDQGQDFIGGYTNDIEKILDCELPVIIFGDHTKSIKLVNQTFAPGADGVKVIKPIDGVDPKLLFYFLHVLVYKIPDKGYARHFQHIEISDLPIPPLPEQQRIVSKLEELLSELDKGIESFKTAREQLKVYRQAVLKHAFEGKLTEGWRKKHADELEPAETLLKKIKIEREQRYQQQLDDWKQAVEAWEVGGKEGKNPTKPGKPKELPPIGEEELSVLPTLLNSWTYFRLAEIAKIGSGMSVSKNRKLEEPVDVPYLRVANVQRGRLDLDEIKTMPVEKNKIKELSLEKWDVLFNEGGDRDKLGRGWVWESKITPCITQNHVFRATTFLGGEIHAKFVSHWGNTFGRDYFERGGKQTTNLASINKTVLSMFPVPFPSIEEQIEIINEIESCFSVVEKLEQDIEDGLRQAETLRESLLKKAFEGRLAAQDPNDEPASVLLERIKTEKAELEKKTREEKKVAV